MRLEGTPFRGGSRNEGQTLIMASDHEKLTLIIGNIRDVNRNQLNESQELLYYIFKNTGFRLKAYYNRSRINRTLDRPNLY